MEELKGKKLTTSKSLTSLSVDLNLLNSDNPVVKEYYNQFRSATIQSFEFSIDTLWKFTKLFLTKKYGISFDAPNPKLVL